MSQDSKDLMDGADRLEPVPLFIEECCTAINPLDVARWLNTQKQFDRKKFFEYIWKAITKQWIENELKGMVLGLDIDRFRKLCLRRIKEVMKRAIENDKIGELRDFAKHLMKRPRILVLPASFNNGKSK